jgi:hypothetical protein
VVVVSFSNTIQRKNNNKERAAARPHQQSTHHDANANANALCLLLRKGYGVLERLDAGQVRLNLAAHCSRNTLACLSCSFLQACKQANKQARSSSGCPANARTAWLLWQHTEAASLVHDKPGRGRALSATGNGAAAARASDASGLAGRPPRHVWCELAAAPALPAGRAGPPGWQACDALGPGASFELEPKAERSRARLAVELLLGLGLARDACARVALQARCAASRA